ncbi:hypothetical protein PFISCL1PPCAC_7069, partial [Pristionchus fissidentatus]
QIYKATFSPPNRLQAEFKRNVMESETTESGLLFSRIRNGKTVVYRACDDPVVDGVEVDGGKEELQGCTLTSLHRRKLIYVSEGTRTGARLIAPNSIVITVTKTQNFDVNCICSSSDSSFVFFLSDNRELSILNTDTMKLNPFAAQSGGKPLIIKGILSADEEKVVVQGRRDGSNEYFVFTVSL